MLTIPLHKVWIDKPIILVCMAKTVARVWVCVLTSSSMANSLFLSRCCYVPDPHEMLNARSYNENVLHACLTPLPNPPPKRARTPLNACSEEKERSKQGNAAVKIKPPICQSWPFATAETPSPIFFAFVRKGDRYGWQRREARKGAEEPSWLFWLPFFPIPIYRGFLSVVTPCIIIFSHSDDSNP